jgi:hypothetical protein
MLETYFIDSLTDNQKRFLIAEGCEVKPFRHPLNYWIISNGYSITINSLEAKIAWELIRDPSEQLTRIYETEQIPSSGNSTDLVIVDEFNIVTKEAWELISAGVKTDRDRAD